MDSEAIDVPERARDTVTGHRPEQRVHSAWLLAEEIPGRVMRGGGLGDLVVAARLDGVDQVGKEDRVLDEEDGDVVSNDIYRLMLDIVFRHEM